MGLTLRQFCESNDRTDLLEEWDFDENRPFTPDNVMSTSNRNMQWRCRKHGHEWTASVANRVKGTTCPYCANRKVLAGFNDLATVEPDLAQEWHPTLNGALRPTDVTRGCSKKVWWKCKTCGHEWQAIVYSRACKSKNGCPMCAGRVNMAQRKYRENILAWANEQKDVQQ